MFQPCSRSPRALVAAATLLLSTGAVPALDSAEPGDSEAEIATSILNEAHDLERRVVGIGRIRVSFPQRVSGALGAMLVRQPVNFDCSTVCEFRGPLFQAEPGYSGGQVSAGYAVVLGEKRRNEHMLSNVYMAYGIKGALLRTWNDADLPPSTRSLVGLETDFTIIGINFSLGAFHPVSGGHPEGDWTITGGMGWGF